MAADIRCLPNDHEAKLQVLEVRDEDKFELNLCSVNLIWLIFLTYIRECLRQLTCISTLINLMDQLPNLTTPFGLL